MSVAENLPQPEPQPQPQPAPAGGDWTAAFPADLKDVVQKNGFTDPASVVKAYAHALPLIGADKIPLPKDGVWDEHARTKLGIPSEPTGYKYERPKLPDGVAWDENFEKTAVAAMHKAGYTPSQVQAAINLYAAQVGGSHAQSAEAAAAAQQAVAAKTAEYQSTLKKEWGQAYEERVATAGRAVQHLGGQGLVDVMNMPMADGTLLGDNPEVMRAFSKIGAQLGEAVLKTGKAQGAMTPAEASAKANEIMNSKDFTSPDEATRQKAIEEVNRLFAMQFDNSRDIRGGVVVQA